jgi:hypothetical protein
MEMNEIIKLLRKVIRKITPKWHKEYIIEKEILENKIIRLQAYLALLKRIQNE